MWSVKGKFSYICILLDDNEALKKAKNEMDLFSSEERLYYFLKVSIILHIPFYSNQGFSILNY